MMTGVETMLYTNKLNENIFNTHNYIECDELIIISGYIGPSPIKRLSSLPIKTAIIYGLFSADSNIDILHSSFLKLHKASSHKILYSKVPVNSNCYIWRKNKNITYALIGSANFTTKGLNTPYRESLAEITRDSFDELNDYLSQILSNSFACDDSQLNFNYHKNRTHRDFPNISCKMALYKPSTEEVPTKSGLNWGNSPKGNTKPGDSYIPIRTSYIRNYPNLFPPKQSYPINANGGKQQRQNDPIELIWDDGVLMDALLEGSQPVDDILYPKQLCSFPHKNTLGHYIRKRLGLKETDLIKKSDLNNYGRCDVTLTVLQNGMYFADFSV